MNCLIFLTHNFTPEFINTLKKLDDIPIENSNLEIIVLFDITNIFDENIEEQFNNIKIIKINRILTSYDVWGHTMYINYFRQNYNDIDKYNYIWIIENDVYYLNSFREFIKRHDSFDYDLLVSEYGTRSLNWKWTQSLIGFKNIKNIGVLAVILRFSKKLMKNLIDNIDKNYYGYLEAILPHICLENNMSIQQFLPELCGILTTRKNIPLMNLIIKDIVNKTNYFIEPKIYHPIKL